MVVITVGTNVTIGKLLRELSSSDLTFGVLVDRVLLPVAVLGVILLHLEHGLIKFFVAESMVT